MTSMNAFEFRDWIDDIIYQAIVDREGPPEKRRFGDDFPLRQLPKSLNGQGARNLAAQIYNAVYEGWES